LTLVIAHRGASWNAPENSLAAFRLAVEAGADYVELDVQASRDGELVVFHDLGLERLTNGRGALRHRTLAELRELDLRAGGRIPTLDEVLELLAGRIGIMLELKSPYLFHAPGIVPKALAALAEHGVEPEALAVVSFEPRALREVRRLRRDVRTVQHVRLGVSIRKAATYAWAAGLESSRATPRAIARAHSLGLATTVYTVNDPQRMRELAELGVTGIFTDRPDLLRRMLAPAPG
jgi:glycerophosphoryl diester phosphodiesterase